MKNMSLMMPVTRSGTIVRIKSVVTKKSRTEQRQDIRDR
jgi:hypothetical protein